MEGAIHNDYRIQNLIFLSDTDCTLIDFDWSCYGPLIKDVALAVGEWSLFDFNKGPSQEAIDQFLKGYNSTSPQKINYDKELIFWISFAYLSEAATFFTDVCEERHTDLVITEISQCHSYKKFRYFYTLAT